MTKQLFDPQIQAVSHTRHLYSVPNRVGRRERWVPARRTLHLLDIENLMGGPFQGVNALNSSYQAYREFVGFGPQDHVVIACNVALAVAAGSALQNGRVLVGHGPDGADIALLGVLKDIEWTAARYDRVVVGSGDGIFAKAVRELTNLGIPVGVSSRPRCLAYSLANAATFVVYLPDAPVEGAVA